MRWLIVEDALRDRKGHWFEYVGTFARELRALGDEVTILAERAAEPFLIEALNAQPVLPASIWHRMSDGSGALRRYARLPVHAINTYRSIKKYQRRAGAYDVIFVPTVLVHHLLGWTWLIKGALKKQPGRVLLFFPNTPVHLDLKSGEPSWQPAPTAKLFNRLVRSLQKEVRMGGVILGVETHPMREAMTRLTGVPFTYFPHPVHCENDENGKQKAETLNSGFLTMACYGPARHEKGSDVLAAAILKYLERFPESRARFVLQWLDDFVMPSGEMARLPDALLQHPRVEIIRRFFGEGEYAVRLADTDILLLPYRVSSYGLRVSRVVIEAMVHGLPVVATRGTTLAEQASEFGAAALCEDGDVESLIQAIETAEKNFAKLRTSAEEKKWVAREHFSVKEFRLQLLT